MSVQNPEKSDRRQGAKLNVPTPSSAKPTSPEKTMPMMSQVDRRALSRFDAFKHSQTATQAPITVRKMSPRKRNRKRSRTLAISSSSPCRAAEKIHGSRLISEIPGSHSTSSHDVQALGEKRVAEDNQI